MTKEDELRIEYHRNLGAAEALAKLGVEIVECFDPSLDQLDLISSVLIQAGRHVDTARRAILRAEGLAKKEEGYEDTPAPLDEG